MFCPLHNHEVVKQILQGILADLCCVPALTKLRFLLKRQARDILSLVRIDPIGDRDVVGS